MNIKKMSNLFNSASQVKKELEIYNNAEEAHKDKVTLDLKIENFNKTAKEFLFYLLQNCSKDTRDNFINEMNKKQKTKNKNKKEEDIDLNLI